jgi:eukaryotic-like serine/threonine-protein kinase
MSADWQKLDDIFAQALEQTPEERLAFLDRVCAGESTLRDEVATMLRAHQQAHEFMETPFLHFDDSDASTTTSLLTSGQLLGTYRIISLLGEGGMGEVYLAEDTELGRKVAIKLVKRGIGTDAIARHLRQEARILAGLNDPHIARLYGAAVKVDGVPYFVMEYVEGERLDEYCNSHCLDISERLELFRRVCAAVGYAHQHLVIHRDLKPGNIRVAPDGEPKLLDFGIAKLLNPGTTAPSEQTMTLAGIMTPAYASPEQVRGEPMTTASDVYSLGVILYELLTAQKPYRVKSGRSDEIAYAIIQQEPIRPSSVLPGEDRKLRIQNRKFLRGDLDNIILKALHKEPERRYSSVAQFSEDIRRHLEGLPVAARSDTVSYRISKFVRRHKLAVAAAALVFLSLVGGIIATMWQAYVARKERDLARVEQAKEERIKSFLTDMLTYASPEYTSSNPARNRDAKVSEVVDQAGKRAEAEMADQPEVLAEVQSTIGGVYSAEGRFDQAEPILRSSRDKTIHLYGADSHQAAQLSGKLADALVGKGNYTEADALFRKDIAIERRLLAEGHGNGMYLAYALADYGAMLLTRNDPAAGACLREALQYISTFSGKERTVVAMLYNDLGNEAAQRGSSDESERFYRAALDEYSKLPPGTYVEKAVTISNLGALLIDKGKYNEAEPFVLEGLELRRKFLGNAHTTTAGGLYRLADLRYKQDRYEEAKQAAQESIEMFKKALATPQDSILFTNPVLEMGMILNKEGRFQEAEVYLRQALAIRNRLSPKGSAAIAKAEGALGECLMTQKRYSEAEPLLVESYNSLTAGQEANSPRTIEAAQRLITLYDAAGNATEAQKYRALLPQPIK